MHSWNLLVLNCTNESRTTWNSTLKMLPGTRMTMKSIFSFITPTDGSDFNSRQRFLNDAFRQLFTHIQVLDGMCSYLNRSFKKQAQEASSSFYEIRTDNVFEIYNLALDIWRLLFFGRFFIPSKIIWPR